MSHTRAARSGHAIPKPIVGLGVLLLLVAGLRMATSADSAYAKHPDPRPDVTAAGVLPAARYGAAPQVSRVYSLAAEIPEILDGLYCYCDCSEHSGHRSLLSCFESDHGAGCDICMIEAETAHRMNAQGESLTAIRAAVDEAWGHR